MDSEKNKTTGNEQKVNDPKKEGMGSRFMNHMKMGFQKTKDTSKSASNKFFGLFTGSKDTKKQEDEKKE